MSKLSEVLEELIIEQNMNHKEFAAAVGISAARITEYIRNEKLPTVTNLVRMADFFNCSTDFLLGREAEKADLTFKNCPPFSEQLEHLTKHFKWDAQSIYGKSGIPKSRYYEWKSGARQPSIDNVIKLANLFDCRVDFILGRE